MIRTTVLLALFLVFAAVSVVVQGRIHNSRTRSNIRGATKTTRGQQNVRRAMKTDDSAFVGTNRMKNKDQNQSEEEAAAAGEEEVVLAAEEGPVELQILGNDGDFSSYPLGLCQGECDTDEDCEEGLMCFQREAGDKIPGCADDGPGFNSRGDFCVALPEQMPAEDEGPPPKDDKGEPAPIEEGPVVGLVTETGAPSMLASMDGSMDGSMMDGEEAVGGVIESAVLAMEESMTTMPTAMEEVSSSDNAEVVMSTMVPTMEASMETTAEATAGMTAGTTAGSS